MDIINWWFSITQREFDKFNKRVISRCGSSSLDRKSSWISMWLYIIWNDEGRCTYEVIYTVIKPIIYTSYWYNCVTELIWTECVNWWKIRYIFPLGNIYIHTHIIRGSVSYSDNWLEGQPAIRSEIETQCWVLAPIPFPVVRRPNNSVGHPKRIQ